MSKHDEEFLYPTSSFMTSSLTSESSTLSGLATGPVPKSDLSSMQAAADTVASSGIVISSSGSDATSDSYAVMNDKVQALAGSIYEELEQMICKYDQDVVKNLMPLIVNVLESLDLSYTETQELEVEVELLKEDNEQLVTQYEREKQLRKQSDQKLLEMEDCFDGERKEAAIKLESLTSIVKMFELKAKNSQDHIVRLEEKESEMKKEFSKLHDRYTELFKTHIDYMERTKSVLGNDRLEPFQSHLLIGQNPARGARIAGMALNQLNRSSGPVSFGYSELENNNHSILSADFASQTTPGVDKAGLNLKTELLSQLDEENHLHKKGAWLEGVTSETQIVDLEVEEAEDITHDPSVGPESPMSPSGNRSKSHTKTEKRTGNTLYQELSFQDTEALGDVDEGADITVNDNYFGMGKEVENLISENNELLATKNALNIVKDDLIAKVDELTAEQEILREEIKSLQEVRSRLQQRIHDLEDELKKIKEESEAAKASKLSEDEDIPMAQRKRFTRVEMARVLMERNTYKEKFMELQEAVRWAEMLRVSRTDPVTTEKKGARGFWKFFGNLFSGNDRIGDPMAPYVNMKYTASSPEAEVSPALTTMRAKSHAERKARSHNSDVFDGDNIESKSSSVRRANERKEQYKQVRAHVNKDDGRMQAYGWSVPTKVQGSAPTTPSVETGQPMPVPVPVYCRPLAEKEPGMKIWCAAAVNMSGGRTQDGGDIVGASVFYHQPPECVADNADGNQSVKRSEDDGVLKLEQQLNQGKKLVAEASQCEQEFSSLVWICTSTHSISKVTVIDANSPADVLESFHVCSSHLLCIASVPGAKEDDYRVDEELNKLVLEETELRNLTKGSSTVDDECLNNEEGGLGTVSFITCATGNEATLAEELLMQDGQEQEQEPGLDDNMKQKENEDTDAVHRRFLLKDPSAKVKDGLFEVSRQNEIAFSEIEKMSSVLSTMWLGSQSGAIYVHSAVSQWKRCIHSIRLNDSVLCIVHVKGRVMAALANGTIAIFHRGPDGQWDLINYHLLDLGKPHHSIRCMVQVHNKVWCGYKNKIYVVNPKMMRVEAIFDAHPRKESQVRQMSWSGDGVWISIRLDSTLRLYHAHTLEHLQDVDIEPYVSKMLGSGKLGFSFVRITSMIISCHRLWMGTGNGVIISVPLAGGPEAKSYYLADVMAKANSPGKVTQLYSDLQADSIIAETFIPFCSMAQAQLSFHGHRDAVKFFVAVPGHGGLTSAASCNNENGSMLIVSGGEGYIDFRLVDDGYEQDFDSHLMVWQVPRCTVASKSSTGNQDHNEEGVGEKPAEATGTTTWPSSLARHFSPQPSQTKSGHDQPQSMTGSVEQRLDGPLLDKEQQTAEASEDGAHLQRQ